MVANLEKPEKMVYVHTAVSREVQKAVDLIAKRHCTTKHTVYNTLILEGLKHRGDLMAKASKKKATKKVAKKVTKKY